mmetsp:Transcript_9087/g.16957  ORF Transcript_9087/g.16957 Transcript_9087/m.16957 type:complete len:88 (+) Transcript_9087:876-1139(+)
MLPGWIGRLHSQKHETLGRTRFAPLDETRKRSYHKAAKHSSGHANAENNDPRNLMDDNDLLNVDDSRKAIRRRDLVFSGLCNAFPFG